MLTVIHIEVDGQWLLSECYRVAAKVHPEPPKLSVPVAFTATPGALSLEEPPPAKTYFVEVSWGNSASDYHHVRAGSGLTYAEAGNLAENLLQQIREHRQITIDERAAVPRTEP